MNITNLYTAAIVAAFSLTNPAFAQAPQPMPVGGNMQQHKNMPMPGQEMMRPAFMPPPAPARPPFADFPSPQEMARMTPPEPLTEEKIKQRFASRKAMLQQSIDRDRKAAEKYAQDFARYQKHQADQLAKIMARAEKRRVAMLNRIDQREQQVLENFRQQQNAPKAVEPAK